MRGFGRNRSGIAAVEFAILAPLFAIAVIGTVDFALRFSAQASLDDALRLALEGAIRLGDDAEGVADFLNQNGYVASVTSFSSSDGSEADVTDKAGTLRLQVRRTEVCFEGGAMLVGPRDGTGCAKPEKWLRMSATYGMETFTSGLVELDDQIDVKVE